MSKTVNNLKNAFAGESQARNKYTFFAKIARAEGYHQIADTLEEAAENEKKHAEIILRLLKGIGNTAANLQEAIDGETHEFEEMYPTFLKEAEEEGEKEAAAYFKEVINAEKNHAEHFAKMLKELKEGTLRKSSEPITWRCRICGFVAEGNEPPALCPLCKHKAEFYDKE